MRGTRCTSMFTSWVVYCSLAFNLLNCHVIVCHYDFTCCEMLRFVRSIYPNLPQMGQNLYHDMLMPLHDSMPSFMNFRRVLDLPEFKNQASQRFAGNQQCPGLWISFQSLAWYLEIHPRTQYDFSTNFSALEHVVVLQIWNMHIKCLENPVNV